MTGAKVDGRIVPITHEVKTGELIEILTSNQPSHGPSRDWLNIVKTNQAKTKIRAWFKKERRPENIATGKSEVEREFSRNNIRLDDENMEKFLTDISVKLRCNSLDDFYAAIGYGGILLSKIMPRVKDAYARFVKTEKPIEVSNNTQTRKVSKSSDGVVVEGIDNCLIKLARCCTPIPGDDLIGFITRGHGVSIHKKDCSNVPKCIEASAEPERWIPAFWDAERTTRFDSTVSILGLNRDGIVADLTILLSNLHVSVHAIMAKETKDGNCSIVITIGVESREHLENVITRIKKLSGVFSVERT
jgi:GTP pyrophosphokinase